METAKKISRHFSRSVRAGIPLLLTSVIAIFTVGCTPPQQGTAKRQFWAIYLESDFNYSGRLPQAGVGSVAELGPGEACGQQKFNSIWESADKVRAEAVKIAATEPLTVEMYALGNSEDRGRLLEANFSRFPKDIQSAGFDSDRERIIAEEIPAFGKSKWDEAIKAHANLIDRRRNNLQDVVASVLQIIQKKDDWFRPENSLVRVIFISDMLHYTSMEQSDPGQGVFNMAIPDSRAGFKQFIDMGMLSSNQRLAPIEQGQQRFEVWNMPVARCEGEHPGVDSVPNWAVLNGDVANIWQTVFTRLGAKTRWNLTDISDLQ